MTEPKIIKDPGFSPLHALSRSVLRWAIGTAKEEFKRSNIPEHICAHSETYKVLKILVDRGLVMKVTRVTYRVLLKACAYRMLDAEKMACTESAATRHGGVRSYTAPKCRCHGEILDNCVYDDGTI